MNSMDSAEEIQAAPGYDVFNSASIKIFLVCVGGGQGVVVDSCNGEKIFMNMAEVGAGLGLAIKDIRAGFFHNAEAQDDFITNRVTIGASVTAAAKHDNKGEAGSGDLLANNMSVCQITDKDMALELMILGTKYWPDSNFS